MMNTCLTEIKEQVLIAQKKNSQGEAFQMSRNDQFKHFNNIIS